ncbi:MAG: glycosyltransferase [Geminicoccaceae bacterium]|nr:glycosyltransferase [Geminicoccaceae bacterium]
MKLVHVVPSYWPAVRYGGPVRSVHGLCAGLAAGGHDVRVLTTNIDGAGVSDVPLDRPVERDGVQISYFAPGLGRRLYRAPALADALRRSLAAADVVHLHAVYLWPGFAAARLAARAGVPYVVSPRGMLVRDLIERKSRLAKTLWITLVERRTLARAGAIHVTSEAEAAALRHLGLDLAPVVLVPNGVDLPPAGAMAADDGAWAGAPAGGRLLCLGRISWEKGLDRAIRALGRLDEAVLVIAGNDETGFRPELERLAAELGVGARVRFVGPVEGQAKWSLLAAADLLVLPSLSENFGLVVLEALGVGTPVVVTAGVGAAEIVRRHELGAVEAGEPEPLAAAIEGLLRDPDRRRSIAERGPALIRRHYGWRALASEMERLYAGLAPGGSAVPSGAAVAV